MKKRIGGLLVFAVVLLFVSPGSLESSQCSGSVLCDAKCDPWYSACDINSCTGGCWCKTQAVGHCSGGASCPQCGSLKSGF
ncbi:MAG: hypothetical protein R2862_12735 [Thermoanaerobaculia bacterium]